MSYPLWSIYLSVYHGSDGQMVFAYEKAESVFSIPREVRAGLAVNHLYRSMVALIPRPTRTSPSNYLNEVLLNILSPLEGNICLRYFCVRNSMIETHPRLSVGLGVLYGRVISVSCSSLTN